MRDFLAFTLGFAWVVVVTAAAIYMVVAACMRLDRESSARIERAKAEAAAVIAGGGDVERTRELLDLVRETAE